jgi:hypothetical protein
MGVFSFENIGDTLGSRLGLGSDKGKGAYKAAQQDWKKASNEWAGKWDTVADFNDPTGARTKTGQRFDELSGLYEGEVDRGAAEAGAQTAAAYARRDMGDSGYATGAQQQNLLRAAQLRAQAREAARSAAVGEREGILGQESQIALQPYGAIFNAAAQRYSQAQMQEKQFQSAQAMMEEEKVADYFMGMGGKMGGGGGGG